MLAQRLSQRITVQANLPVAAASGEIIGHAWQDFLADEPAEVLEGPGREALAGQQKTAEVSARIRVRWQAGYLPSMRVLWDGRVFDIRSIERDRTARREAWLHCTDGATDGS